MPAYEFSAEQANQSQYMVLRHNVQRYGLWEKDYDWYIFNQPDIILKMATFWLIRLSSAWKRVKFRTYLHKLPFEAFDCLTLEATGYVASGPVKMVVEKADYNSAENCIDFECAMPVGAAPWCRTPFTGPRCCRNRRPGPRRPTSTAGTRAAAAWERMRPGRFLSAIRRASAKLNRVFRGRPERGVQRPRGLGRPDTDRRGLCGTGFAGDCLVPGHARHCPLAVRLYARTCCRQDPPCRSRKTRIRW